MKDPQITSAREIGLILARCRKAQPDLSQASLGALVGLSPITISRIERGGDLRLSTLFELARALGLEPMLVPRAAVPAVRALIDDEAREPAARERGRFER